MHLIFIRPYKIYGFFQLFGYQKWFFWIAYCTKRSGMLILGTILSLRASGSNVFCRRNLLRSVLPKRFALRMSWDFDCFLFKLRNAGAYIPKGTPCTLHVSTNLLINASRHFLSRTHVSWKLLEGGCHRRFLTCHRHLHICAHTINNRGWAGKCGTRTNADSQVDAWCTPG